MDPVLKIHFNTLLQNWQRSEKDWDNSENVWKQKERQWLSKDQECFNKAPVEDDTPWIESEVKWVQVETLSRRQPYTWTMMEEMLEKRPRQLNYQQLLAFLHMYEERQKHWANREAQWLQKQAWYCAREKLSGEGTSKPLPKPSTTEVGIQTEMSEEMNEGLEKMLKGLEEESVNLRATVKNLDTKVQEYETMEKKWKDVESELQNEVHDIKEKRNELADELQISFKLWEDETTQWTLKEKELEQENENFKNKYLQLLQKEQQWEQEKTEITKISEETLQGIVSTMQEQFDKDISEAKKNLMKMEIQYETQLREAHDRECEMYSQLEHLTQIGENFNQLSDQMTEQLTEYVEKEEQWQMKEVQWNAEKEQLQQQISALNVSEEFNEPTVATGEAHGDSELTTTATETLNVESTEGGDNVVAEMTNSDGIPKKKNKKKRSFFSRIFGRSSKKNSQLLEKEQQWEQEKTQLIKTITTMQEQFDKDISEANKNLLEMETQYGTQLREAHDNQSEMCSQLEQWTQIGERFDQFTDQMAEQLREYVEKEKQWQMKETQWNAEKEQLLQQISALNVSEEYGKSTIATDEAQGDSATAAKTLNVEAAVGGVDKMTKSEGVEEKKNKKNWGFFSRSSKSQM